MFKTIIAPPVSPFASLKATEMGWFLGITVEKVGPHVGAWTDKLKNHTNCIWRWGPTVGTTSSVLLHIYVLSHTSISELSLHM